MDPITYTARSRWLPADLRQEHFDVDGIRPDRGPCPSCGAHEDWFCARSCYLTDPYEPRNLAGRLERCGVCLTAREAPVPDGLSVVTWGVVVHGLRRHIMRVQPGRTVMPLCSKGVSAEFHLYPGEVW